MVTISSTHFCNSMLYIGQVYRRVFLPEGQVYRSFERCDLDGIRTRIQVFDHGCG